ncbi:hypothetical protein [Microvirga pakistanensis]|uniref:hypothetical protein n=1 Tax=Microvirga pakistanensis TaxID=1682650 RepID=UPI001069AEE2|nr:hypothetical protein [Microvirga pakistanensis]
MMDPFLLPQTLILPLGTLFADIEACLSDLGFSQAESGVVTRPVLPGEPELARWRFRGGLPIVEYSFNPVVSLRLLEVATVPPELRGKIAERLRPLPPEAVTVALASDDTRQQLFGVWAAVETERIDLIYEVTKVYEASRGVLREEAEAALHRLGDRANMRMEMLQAVQMIREAAMDVLTSIRSPESLVELMPDENDCAELFDASIAGKVFDALDAQGAPGRRVQALPSALSDVSPAPAGALRWPNELSDRFPRGYRRIAGWMVPSRIWLAWTGREPDGGVLRMDGLVFVNGRWVFLPKPWRLIEPMIADRLGRMDASN